ncbi:hypothetical protein, partial [Geothermobacter hydrogeniphilus]
MFRFAHLALMAVLAMGLGLFGTVDNAVAYSAGDPIYINLTASNYCPSQGQNFTLTVTLTDFDGNPVTGQSANLTLKKVDDVNKSKPTHTFGTAAGDFTDNGDGTYTQTGSISDSGNDPYYAEVEWASGNYKMKAAVTLNVGAACSASVPAQFDSAPDYVYYPTSGTVVAKFRLLDQQGNPYTGATLELGNAGNGGQNTMYINKVESINKDTMTWTVSSATDNGDGTYDFVIDYSGGINQIWVVEARYEYDAAANVKLTSNFAFEINTTQTSGGSPTGTPPINPGAPGLTAPPCSATAPTDLVAVAPNPTQVDLTWTYDGTNNNYYTIYRGGTQIATNVTTGSYTDSTVAAGTAYSYTVRGHNNTDACDSADSNIANVTTPACTELTPSSISFNGVNTAAGDFSGASMVTPVDLMNLEFRVTEGTGGGAPFSQTDNFDANNFGNWTPSDTNTSNNWLLDANTTPSSNVGPSGDHTGGGYYAYTESSSGSYPETYWLTSNVLDGSTYALNLDFWWNMNTDTDLSCELHVDVSTDGGTNWTNSVWSRTNNPNSGDVWVNQNVDLSAYTSNNLEVRFRTISSSWRCDTALDDIVISGPARATEVERLAWNPDPQEASAILTNGNSYNLYARGTDPECGTVYYVGGTTTPGNSQSFTWSSCTETTTLNAPTFSPATTPITGPVTVTATGTATGIQVSWSEDGGATWSTWFANGATYTPTSCITGNVIFRARGTGTCGTLTAQSAAAAFDTTDKDVATLTTTNPSPATGIVTIQ